MTTSTPRPDTPARAPETRPVRLTTIVPPPRGLRDLESDPDHLTNLSDIIDHCPPVVLQRGSLRLIDGLHRLEVARHRGRTHVVVEVIDVPDELLSAERIRRNSVLGLPLSRHERRRAAQRLLREHPDWSVPPHRAGDRPVADHRRVAPAAGPARGAAGDRDRDPSECG